MHNCVILRAPNQADAKLWEDEIQKDQHWQADEHFSSVGEFCLYVTSELVIGLDRGLCLKASWKKHNTVKIYIKRKYCFQIQDIWFEFLAMKVLI